MKPTVTVEKSTTGICNDCGQFCHLIAIALPRSYAATLVCYVCARAAAGRINWLLDSEDQ